jgi:hypothetical protein
MFSMAQLGKEYKDKRAMSAQQIIDLKKGALFVRIRNRSRQVASLKKYGRDKEALEVEQKRAALNKKIIKAFTRNFKFCTVYFFYSQDSKFIRLQQYDSVKFVDSTLKHNPLIRPKHECYFTAELGTVAPDTARYFGGYYLAETENGLEQKARYYKSADSGFKALVVKSNEFVQLAHPFPYYVRSYSANPSLKRMLWYVKKLNIALEEYYEIVKAELLAQ